ncbi:Phage capsid family protein [Pelagimonas phthalicica]|uniref:Phage capsid family protein n=1 Tax=Pelagimonas phthalicica TaxID=1037362 RepID=A0A238JBQ3_9RHOB|nr:phage major capsid protein [Pelagimonas phthalicica]TDS94189.1 HK97 family phage prohead protease/HK97 family phage major capsid protein,TIGR01554 [Pelagimonas phthalicica]SMX27286.1 Phage capsid family protein [Pelagimonas phthalicica]
MTKMILKKNSLAASWVGFGLTRALTVEQINANRGASPLQRHAAVRNVDEEARTVEVAFSSEEPVSRWFGDEILDHSPGAMVQTRLQNGAAVLWNHDADIHIGVVDSATIDPDRVGRAVLRFGRSAKAEEIWLDVAAGIIRHVSVGYFVRAIKTEEREGQRDKVTVTEWEPYEISLVSVPADPTVGVGRAVGEPPEEPGSLTPNNDLQTTATEPEGPGEMHTKILRNANGDLVRAKVDDDGNIVEVVEVLERAADTQALVTRGTQAEQQRTASLLEMGEQYSAQQLAAEAIRNGTSVDEFTRTLLDHVNGGDGGGNEPLDDNAGEIGMTESEVRRFSFIRAARALLHPESRSAQEEAAFEREASEAAQQSMGRSSDGITVPVDVLTRALNTSTSGANPGDTGGFLVDTTLASQSFIEMLRNRATLLSLGTPMGGLVGNLDMPGQTGSGNVFIVGEDEDVGEGSMDTGLIKMSPTTIGVFGSVTRRMLQQSSMDVELQFRSSLATDLALGVDHYGFYGDGVGNNPLGVLNTTGINAVPFAGQQPTYGEIIEMETEVALDNALTSSVRYVGNAKFRGHCKSTEKFAGSNGQPVWENGNTVNGSKTEITNQFANGDVLFGNLKDVLIGLWGALDILVDPYTKSLSGTRRIVLHQDFDVALRRKESFCLGRSV